MNMLRRRVKYILLKLHLYDFCHQLHLNLQLIKYINVIKSIYFNFKIFPISVAWKLPIAIGWNTKIKKIGIITIQGKISTFMITLGAKRITEIETYDVSTQFCNKGTIVFSGRIKIHPGAKIWVYDNAIIKFGGLNTIGARSLLVAQQQIIMGNNTGCSWDCQIMDTDFHYLRDLIANRVISPYKPIHIGNDVFIGNHVNIGKGTKITDGSIISSWSKVQGSFTKQGDNLLIAGNPGVVIGTGYTMTHGFEGKLEKHLSFLINKN